MSWVPRCKRLKQTTPTLEKKVNPQKKAILGSKVRPQDSFEGTTKTNKKNFLRYWAGGVQHL